jgi:S1-C subfamily serine protease
LAVELGGLLTPEVVYGVDVDGLLTESIAAWSDDDVKAQDALGFLVGNEWNALHVCPTDASWAAGMRREDQLVSINDQRFADRPALTKFVAALKPGAPLNVAVRRGDEQHVLTWNFGAQSAGAELHQIAAAQPMTVLGDDLAVVRVDRRSDAYSAGLRTGDVVSYVNGRKVESIGDAARALTAADPTREQIHLVALRDGEPRSLLWKVRQPARSP